MAHACFLSPISLVPFALDLLSRKGSLGCLLCSVHEVSNAPFPTSFVQKGGNRLLAQIYGRAIEAIERRMGSVKVGVRNLPPLSTGCVPANEQCVSLPAKEADRHEATIFRL